MRTEKRGHTHAVLVDGLRLMDAAIFQQDAALYIIGLGLATQDRKIGNTRVFPSYTDEFLENLHLAGINKSGLLQVISKICLCDALEVWNMREVTIAACALSILRDMIVGTYVETHQ